MRVTGPRDLPDFRLWLIDQWRPGGLFAEVELFMRASGQMPERGLLPPGVVDGVIQRGSIPRAALWWVTDDMTDLIEHAAMSLPETTLTEDLLPDDDGLVVFAHSLGGTQCDTGEPITTDVIVWSRGMGRLADGGLVDAINIASYHYIRNGDDLGNAKVGHMQADRDMWTPTGTATWTFGADTEAAANAGGYADHLDEPSQASTSEDRRWLAALWLLAAQPLTTSATTPAYRGAAKRSERAKVNSDVRIVNVRRHERGPQADGEHAHAGYSHRFIVGGETGGFWRQQAYGPHHSLRRPQWIDPFVKGPADKPLKVRETVKIVRGEPVSNSKERAND